jgi:hypothetical protein
MRQRPGKQKSGNVVLLAGYTHGAIGYDRSGAERKFGGYIDRLKDQLPGGFYASTCCLEEVPRRPGHCFAYEVIEKYPE